MPDKRFDERVLEHEDELAELAGHLIDGDQTAFAEAAVELVSTVALGTPVPGKLAGKVARLAFWRVASPRAAEHELD